MWLLSRTTTRTTSSIAVTLVVSNAVSCSFWIPVATNGLMVVPTTTTTKIHRGGGGGSINFNNLHHNPKKTAIRTTSSSSSLFQTASSPSSSSGSSSSSNDNKNDNSSSKKNKKKDDELTVPSLPRWDPTNWTPKAFHNTPLARSAAILITLAAVGIWGTTTASTTTTSATASAAKTIISTTNTPTAFIKVAAVLHLLSYSTWFGTIIYTTFVAGITMFQNLPRQTFGRLQSKLFPKYFNLCSISILLQMITLRILSTAKKSISSSSSSSSWIALATAMTGTLMNQFVLEPTSSKIMLDRYQLEELPGGKESIKYQQLASSFGKYHGISSLLNLIAICAAIAHGVQLAMSIIVH